MTTKIELDLPIGEPEFLQLCKELDISYIGVFGSVSRGEQRADSDLDLLVHFSKPQSLLDVIEAELRLEEYLGREVDIVTEGNIKPRIEKHIMEDLVDLYGTR
jgi:predicted nucleotidyltransferase